MSLVVSAHDFHSPEEIVEFLKLDYSEIQHILQTLGRRYRPINLRKLSGKNRRLLAPDFELKNVQKVILDELLAGLPLPDSIHGYRKGRSIVTNAEQHVQQEMVINIDIENFFPSVHPERVKRNFLQLGYRESVAQMLTRLCTFDYQLPQGAPTSPALANLGISETMSNLEGFCRKGGVNFTGYSDDLSFSGPLHIEKYVETFMSILRRNGFRVNRGKIKIQPFAQAQEVTGLIVNNKISLKKSLKKQVRAMLHMARTKGPAYLHRDGQVFHKNQLHGLILYINSGDRELGKKLLQEFRAIDWD